MNAARASTHRPFARAGLILALLAGAVLALNSIPAAAATVIGQATGTVGMSCTNMDTVQLSSVGVNYAVPTGGGIITSWSTTANTNLGPAGLLVWRPTATANAYTLVASTTPTALVLGLNTFNLNPGITVQAGDVLGLRSEGRTDCIASAATGNVIGYHTGATAATETLATDPLALTLNVSATIGTVAPPTGTPPPTGGGGGTPPPTGGGGGTPPPTGGGGGTSSGSGDQHESTGSEPDDNGRATHPTHTKHTKPTNPTKSDSSDKQQSSGDSTKSTGHSTRDKEDLFFTEL
jgi:hypothetical protein